MYKSTIDFGDSYVHHDNFILGFFMHQTIVYTIKIIENSSWWAGTLMYSHFVGPLVTQALNNYTMEIELEHPVIGQTTKDKFVLDYKNTRSPNVDPNFIDFFFEGELLHGNHKCVLEPEKMAFMNSKTAS